MRAGRQIKVEWRSFFILGYALLLLAKHLRCELNDQVLFSGLNLQLDQGAALQLAGANGRGKTTLLRGLLGLNDWLQGDWQWQPPLGGGGKRPSPAQVGYIGHRSGLNVDLSPLENLAFLQQLRRQDSSEAERLAALEAVDLLPVFDLPVRLLSAGQQRRVALAQLFLAKGPSCWALDEPFTALDQGMLVRLNEQLMQLMRSGSSLLLISHQAMHWSLPSVEVGLVA